MKFFFDNNLSPYLANAIKELSTVENYDVLHLRDKFQPSVSDAEWLHKLGTEGNWVVISGDRRISTNPHEKEVWKQAKLITFFLAKGWSDLRHWDKSWRLVKKWPLIVQQASQVAPGAVFMIQVSSDKFKQP